MISKLKLINFRNFKNNEFIFSGDKNFIIGDNGIGKTNILEAICLIYQKDFSKFNINSIVNENEENAFIEAETGDGKNFAISFDKNQNSKNLLINGKKTTKSKFQSMQEKIVLFQPMDMNIMYLSPSLRRDFLDNILSNSFSKYSTILNDYKKIVRNRNATLKSIRDGKIQKSEINFWNDKLIEKSLEIYDYRNELNNFFSENIQILKSNLNQKIQDVKYNYISKVDLNDIESSIKNYLNKNFERDIILGSTQIGPHVDDFEILLNSFSAGEFASRGETKSIFMGLKTLEINFIKSKTSSDIIFLIDDLFSELDTIHENILLDEFRNNQTIITSINLENFDTKKSNIINL